MKISIVTRHLARFVLFASLTAACAGSSVAGGVAYKRLRLPNGLTVLVHEDHKAPIVSVGVWYGTGSADDPAGESGLAHLSEHLMFYGSEHHDAPHLETIQAIGGTDIQGATDFDEMIYSETVPTEALDKVLWLESDRMGHLTGALDEARLRTQRGVVLNERRDMLESPSGRSQANFLRHIFPANHPYHRDGYGLPGDLEKVSLERVRSWFHQHHGAANATVIMAGDITPEVAREKAMAYFADIAPGPDQERQQPWVVPLAVSSRGVMHDKFAHRRIVKAWPVPQSGSAAVAPLRLSATILGHGESSRLHRRLVITDGLATDVGVTLSSRALASAFVITVDVAEGADLAAVESAIDGELATFITQGPSEDELILARTREEADFLASTETMSGVVQAMALGQVRHGDPEAEWGFRERLGTTAAAHLREVASTWLGRPGYTLTVMPAPDGFDAEAEDASDAGRGPAAGKPSTEIMSTRHLTATEGWSIDRNLIPAVGGGFPKLSFPVLERGRLANGAELVLARREGAALTDVRFQFGGGTRSDHPPGMADFVMSMVLQGTSRASAPEFARQIDRLGAKLSSDCDADTCYLDLKVPRGRLTDGVALVAEALRHAAFRPGDIERVRRQHLAIASARQADSYELAAGIMARLHIDENHPYTGAVHGPGMHESIGVDTRDLLSFRDDILRPDNLRVIVVGDESKETALAALKIAIGDWKAPGKPMALPSFELAEATPGEVAYLVDRPQSLQSHILLGLLAPRASNTLSFELANMAFASGSGSRLDANLRDAKGWTYGVLANLVRQQGPRPLIIDMPVQADRTGDAIGEVRREIAVLVDGQSPLTDTEVRQHTMGVARSLAGGLERGRSVLLQIADDVTFGRSDDFLQTLPETLRQTAARDVNQALKDVLQTSRRTWVIVGDRKHIEGPLRQQFPGLRILDVEGRVIE
ncbi:pitrilysin family protein [Luteibacter sp.]|uniref:M16 family metallopeptidase n=1 Tax=Luteibacter sp. TaxID=1886636 RepID=UPI002F40080E